MGPGYSSGLSISTSPRLTHDFSASWRVPAAAVREQDSPPPWDSHMPDFSLTVDANPVSLAVLLPHLRTWGKRLRIGVRDLIPP